MLSDHELDALRDIERRLRWDSPELARLFSTVEPPPPRSRRKRARAKLLVAAAVFTGMALRGPRMLNEAAVCSAEDRPRGGRTTHRPNPCGRDHHDINCQAVT